MLVSLLAKGIRREICERKSIDSPSLVVDVNNEMRNPFIIYGVDDKLLRTSHCIIKQNASYYVTLVFVAFSRGIKLRDLVQLNLSLFFYAMNVLQAV